MASASSTNAVLVALAGNSFLTVIKFVAFMFSGSGAMLSEAIHSFADTGNQALLWLGIKKSKQGPTPLFSYGQGSSTFLFALFSAVGIFVLGCGVTIYHGVHLLIHPGEVHGSILAYSVLGISLLVDAFILNKALKAAREQAGDKTLLQFLRTTSDPTIAAVLLEDGVACLGVLIALAGILLSVALGNPLPDAIATLLIGLMLGGIAVWLGYKNSRLLLGTSIPDSVRDDVVGFLESQDTVTRVRAVQSRVVGAESYKFKAEVDWDGGVLALRHAEWAAQELAAVESDAAREEFLLALGHRITDSVAEEIDRIEVELRERHPELQFVDLESD